MNVFYYYLLIVTVCVCVSGLFEYIHMPLCAHPNPHPTPVLSQ